MAKFRKKPVVVDAVQYLAGLDEGSAHKIPGVCTCTKMGVDHYGPHIHTLEGVMQVSDGDYVITGVNGEHYPCKPDIFLKTYEPVTTFEPEPGHGWCIATH